MILNFEQNNLDYYFTHDPAALNWNISYSIYDLADSTDQTIFRGWAMIQHHYVVKTTHRKNCVSNFEVNLVQIHTPKSHLHF